jgi:hypothetical protein
MSKHTAPLAEITAFLTGEAPLEGVWFGERTPAEKGMFWWRKRLIADANQAADHALVCWAMCVGAARWEPWGDGRGEFCMNGLRHATKLDAFGCPEVTGPMRAAILKVKAA